MASVASILDVVLQFHIFCLSGTMSVDCIYFIGVGSSIKVVGLQFSLLFQLLEIAHSSYSIPGLVLRYDYQWMCSTPYGSGENHLLFAFPYMDLPPQESHTLILHLVLLWPLHLSLPRFVSIFQLPRGCLIIVCLLPKYLLTVFKYVYWFYKWKHFC